MDSPLIFLDIDGVLNDHTVPDGVLCGQIQPCKIAILNDILRATDARIVVSSAWRYLVHRGEMNLRGLSWLLQSHGLLADKLVGITTKDTEPLSWDGNPASWVHTEERGAQISAYLAAHPCSRYCVIDDLDLGISAAGHPFVQTDSKVGLTYRDAAKVIELLNLRLLQIGTDLFRVLVGGKPVGNVRSNPEQTEWTWRKFVEGANYWEDGWDNPTVASKADAVRQLLSPSPAFVQGSGGGK